MPLQSAFPTRVVRPAKPEKPRYIRDLRRSAARSRRRERILLTALRACYSNVRKRFRGEISMASFNTMAGCFLASALFAMVVGKVSNALVSVHEPEKPAIAVSEAAPEAAGEKPAE